MKKHLTNQDGVTLLLSILILSGLVLVSLAVAGFTIQEIRSSRAQVVSEPALTAAESGAEQALWQYKRNGGVPDCTSSPVSDSLTTSNAITVYCRSYSGDTFDVTNSNPTLIYLYDPSDASGDVDLHGYPYDWISFINKSNTFSASIRVTRLDGTPVGPQPLLVNPNSTQQIDLSPVAAGSEGRMQISMQSTGSPIQVNVTTDRGLPDVINLDSSGCSSKSTVTSCSSSTQELFTRKIQVKIR